MTAERHLWADGKAEEFDYAKMAAEALERVDMLKAELDALRAAPAHGFEEALCKNSRIHLKEDQLMEHRSAYRFFAQRAKERGQSL